MCHQTEPKRSPLLQLRELAQRRWRVLLGYADTRALVLDGLGRLGAADPSLGVAIEDWAQTRPDREAKHRLRSATRSLAARLSVADRLGTTARALEGATEAFVGRNPTSAGLAHVMTVRVVSRDYVALRNELLEANLGLVRLAVSRLEVPPARRDDMVHEGLFGLARALECFDPHRGTAFSTYAMYWVRMAVLRAMNDRGQEIRIPAHMLGRRRAFERSVAALDDGQPDATLRIRARNAAGLSERQLQAVEAIPSVHSDPAAEHDEEDHPDPLSEIHTKRLLRRLRSVIPKLDARERSIILHRFELEGRPFRTLAQLGQGLGLSRERVRQIQLEALERLRLHLAPSNDDPGTYPQHAA